MTWALAALLGLALSAAEAGAQTTLRWKLKPGDVTKYQFSQKNKITTTVNGMDLKTDSELTLDLTWTVKSASSDKIEVSQKLDRAQAKGTGPQGAFAYDSQAKEPPADPVGQVVGGLYNAVVGSEATLVFNDRGELASVAMPKEVLDKIPNSIPQTVRDSGSVFSEAGLKNLLLQVLPRLPKDPVKTGSKWDEKLELPMPPIGTLVLNSKYTYKDAGASDSAISIEVKNDPGGQIGIEVKSQKGEGGFTFNTGAGQVEKTRLLLDLGLTIKAKDQEIPQTIVIDATLSKLPGK